MFGLSASPLPPQELAELLLAFARAPGNFLVRLGEPRALHAQLDTVAAWAVGRIPDELAERGDALREAAVFFIQRACFAADNNHYQVLGLTAIALTPEALRARYRALIRVTHPDMGVAGLPADAARVVNRANEVLSDPALRERYDEQLALEAAGTVVPAAAAGLQEIPLRPSVRDRWQSLAARYPQWTQWLVPVLGVVVAAAALVVWVSNTGSDQRLLIVARTPSADGGEPVRTATGPRPEVRVPPKPLPTYSAPPPPSTVRSVLPAAPAPAVTDKPTLVASALTASPVPRSPTAPAAAPPEPRASQQKADEAIRTDPTAALRDARTGSAFAPSAPSTPNDRPDSAPASAQLQGSGPAAQSALQQAAPPLFRVAATSTAAPPAPAPSPSPSPSPAPAPSTAWAVDAGQANSYLADLLMSLERPRRARRNNDYLAEMNVQGSLLHPALQLMRRFPDVAVEQMNWSDHNRPGAMSLRGQMTLRATNPDTGEVRKVNFRLDAEFWGTREGTVMATLNLREDQ